MNQFISRTLLALIAGLGSVCILAGEDSAPGIVLSSGVEGGGYWNAGTRLQRVAEEMDIAVENLPSAGSLENLGKLLDENSPVNLAFAQADATQHYLNDNKSADMKLEMLENIGQECVFIVTDTNSEIRTDVDMQEAQDLNLGIPSATSGVAVTLDYMTSQIPEMSDIDVSYGDLDAAMEQLGTPEATVDAVMMVHRPKERSPEVNAALANSERYQFVQLSDERLTEKLWNGQEIYRTMKLAMPGAAKPLETICVRGLLLVNKQKLSPEQRNRLGDLVSYHWMRVYATQ